MCRALILTTQQRYKHFFLGLFDGYGPSYSSTIAIKWICYVSTGILAREREKYCNFEALLDLLEYAWGYAV